MTAPDDDEVDDTAVLGETAQLAAYGDALVDAVDAVVADWVRRCVVDRCEASGIGVDDEADADIDAAAEECRARVVEEMRRLLRSDVDAQSSTPLQIIRSAVTFPTGVLTRLGAVPAERDDFERRAFPDDPYGLTPGGFGDVDESLVGPGIAWGAAKAHVHRRRHAARR